MDLLTRADLERTAQSDQPGDHVSLFIPTHRFGEGAREGRGDPIRWKNLLNKVEPILAQRGLRSSEVDDLLAPAWALHRDALAWEYMSDGLAMFLRSGWAQMFRVPLIMPAVAAVGERFVVGPLLPLVTRDSHFLVLTLSQRKVRLLEGSRQRMEELELREIPTSLRDVIGATEPRSHTMARPASAATRGGPAVFYGHGAADEHFKKDEVRAFLRQVGRGVREYLHDRDLPMVLVGLDELVAIYRDVDGYPHVADEAVRQNPDQLSAEQLHEVAWPIVERILRAQRLTATERFEQLHGTGRASTDPEAIAEAARQGRVDILFLSAQPWCWEQIPGDAPVVELGSVDFVRCELEDRAATDTLSQQGDAYAVPASAVPGGADMAAIFRY